VSSVEDKKAVVLLSGGLDSATVLAIAQSQGFRCYALSFDYQQRHRCELEAARRIAEQAQVEQYRVMSVDLSHGGSALTDMSIAVPNAGGEAGIPITYVPARNTVFLSLALAWSEVLQAQHIFIGVNAVDYSGYPDCRPEYIAAFEHMANLATKSGVTGQRLTIHTPLIAQSKAEIIHQGVALGVDYAQTVSCYNPDKNGLACGQCDACELRRLGFEAAGVTDPTRYQPS